ncbi:hypothetical protein [Bacteriovorax sp. Seq25_V]|nr:hypothetical protein [Bacteriovorax sp. Seq25_V]EQC44787.1 hypothetical protein M900_0389 [Bacteriovorax sp. Seq25_V]
MEKEEITLTKLQELIKLKLEDPEVAQKTAQALSNLLNTETKTKPKQ